MEHLKVLLRSSSAQVAIYSIGLRLVFVAQQQTTLHSAGRYRLTTYNLPNPRRIFSFAPKRAVTATLTSRPLHTQPGNVGKNRITLLQPGFIGYTREIPQEARAASYAEDVKYCGRYVAQNQDSNLAIIKLTLMVQSSVGTFEVSGDKYPFLRDQQNIWDQHKRNCNAEYFADGGFGDWQKRQCCVLLSVSQYLHGLGSSAGVAFPIQISATVTLRTDALSSTVSMLTIPRSRDQSCGRIISKLAPWLSASSINR